MLLSVSWRNIWRNKLRSTVLLLAVAIGITAGVFSWAFYWGMVEQRIETAIQTEVSHIQIHKKGYNENPDVNNNITGINSTNEEILKIEGVKSVSGRILDNAMIMSAEKNLGVTVVGINPGNEKQVTNISDKLVQGDYFEGVKKNPVIIGEKLAKKLNVEVRKKIVLVMQQTNGELTRAQFRVAGIFKTPNGIFNEGVVFVKNDDLSRVLGMNSESGHEIAILLENSTYQESVLQALNKKYPDLDIKPWREILPEVALMEESMDISMMVMIIVILFALLFGIINTMLMAILERTKEIGMLMAIGMNKWRVFNMILLETLCLTLTGAIIGIIISSVLSVFFHEVGFDLSSGAEAYERLGYDSIVYPVLTLEMLIKTTIMVIITSILAAIYPAIKALSLKPAEAIRTDL